MDNGNRKINWYPGHMAKTRRLLQDQLKRIDLVIELCDARLPHSSRNPELGRMICGKKRILFLNKADLADSAVTKTWIRVFREQGIEAYLLNARTQNVKETISIINRVTSEIVQKAKERGVRKTVRAMVIGVPNVGKSTLINQLRGTAVTETGDHPGVTKSNQWVRISPYLEIMDTPGMLWPRLDDQNAARKLCYIGSVSDDVVDIENLAICLLRDLKQINPAALEERFHILNIDADGADLLDEICKGRGWLLKGGQSDYDRCCKVVLDEYRSGKLGKITLEKPDDLPVRQNDKEYSDILCTE